jgi:hypothetical protein
MDTCSTKASNFNDPLNTKESTPKRIRSRAKVHPRIYKWKYERKL